MNHDIIILKGCKAVEYYTAYKHLLDKWPEKGMIVNDIAKFRKSKQSNASHFARTGYDYGVMDRKRDGQHIYYTVNKKTIAFIKAISQQIVKELPVRNGIPKDN